MVAKCGFLMVDYQYNAANHNTLTPNKISKEYCFIKQTLYF